MNSRNYYFDNAKFFLICMVILGHCIARLGSGEIENAVDASVYFFHMPVFIFISGYFSKKTDFQKFKKTIIKLCEALIVFELLHISLRIALFDYKITISTLLVPQWSLWYLLSLIFWRTIVQYIMIPPRSFFVAIVIGVIAGFVPLNGPISFQRTCSLLPFFISGYLCGREKVDLSIIEKIPIVLAAGIILALPFVVYCIDFPFKDCLEGLNSYHKFGFPLWFSAIMRLLLYICCFIASVCVMRLIPQKRIPWISEQGANTLLYYLYHTLIIYVLIWIREYVNLPTSFVAILCYLILIVFIIWCMTNITFFKNLPNIISFYINKRKIS